MMLDDDFYRRNVRPAREVLKENNPNGFCVVYAEDGQKFKVTLTEVIPYALNPN